jgi:hypothetical protein
LNLFAACSWILYLAHSFLEYYFFFLEVFCKRFFFTAACFKKLMELVMILCAVTNSMGVKGGRLVKLLMLYNRLIIYFLHSLSGFLQSSFEI